MYCFTRMVASTKTSERKHQKRTKEKRKKEKKKKGKKGEGKAEKDGVTRFIMILPCVSDLNKFACNIIMNSTTRQGFHPNLRSTCLYTITLSYQGKASERSTREINSNSIPSHLTSQNNEAKVLKGVQVQL